MERRYALLSESVRNIEGYNVKARAKKPDPRIEEGILPRGLPYLVIVIDELADLDAGVLPGHGRVSDPAEQARASGIHLIVATQRPSVDVITGLIKANMPASPTRCRPGIGILRVILDAMGAERLLGMGDLLSCRRAPPA